MKKTSVISVSKEELKALTEKRGLKDSGRIQYVTTEDIKSHFGSLWNASKEKVLANIEKIIIEKTTPEDIILRYQEDKYVIILANVEATAVDTTADLISDMIKEQYFSSHESDGNAAVSVGKVAVSKPPKAAINNEQERKERNPLNCIYVPLWNVNQNALISYLCLAQGTTVDGDPYDCHEALFVGATPSMIYDLDFKVLKTVAYALDDLVKRQGKLFIVCPVHYETLSRQDSHDKYISACQKIPPNYKKFLTFLVIGIPDQIHTSNMSRYFGSLTKHCNALYGQVPLNPKMDFHVFSNSHFSVLGVRLKKVKGSEKKMIEDLAAFNEAAKKCSIKNVFALDVSSLSITTSSVCAGLDLLGGTAIHEGVVSPDNVYRFMHEDLFESMVAERQNEWDVQTTE